MLNIPSEVVALLKADSVHKNFRVIFPSGEHDDITNENLVAESVHFTESVMSQDKFKLGLCESPVIEFEAFDIENIKGKKIECYYEIYCEDTVEDAVYREDLDTYVYPIPLGVFYVDSCKKEAKMNIRQVIAYGMQAYLEWKIPKDSVFPMDLSDAIAVALQSDETLINASFNTDVYNHVMRQGYDTTSLNIYVVGSGGVTTVNTLYRTVPLVRHTFTNIRKTGSSNYTFISIQESFKSIKETYRCGVNNGGTGKFLFKYSKNGKYYSPMPVYNAYATFLRGFIDPDIDGFEFVSLNIDEREIAGGINKYRYATNPVSCDINVKLQTDFVPIADIPELFVKDDINGSWYTVGTPDSLRTLMRWIKDSPQYAGAYAELVDFYSAYPNPFERSLNGDDTDVLLGAYTHDTIGITVRDNNQISRDDMQKYAENYLEIAGKMGRFDRGGNFEAFTIDTDTDVDTITPSEYQSAWYDDELSLPYGACSANHKVNGTDTYTIVYADGYDADSDPSTYQIYDISDNDLVKEMTVEEITPILTTIITNLSTLQYMPSDIGMVGRPDIEVGDRIEVQTSPGAFNTYVLSRTIDGIQGLTDTITAK